MSAAHVLPSVSIVIEWETGGECGGGRSHACLAELNRQMWEAKNRFPAGPELILVPDPSGESVDDATAAAAGLTWPGAFQIAEPPAALDYYRKKNFGFARSRGELVLFVDSDLAPEPDWLLAMTEPFADPAKSVVVGRTHFETRSLYERAVALFWIFDARCPEDLVRPTRRLVSNNIAFRRPLFAALPFPERDTYRGQCSELGAKLHRLGVAMYEATAARAAHPAPAGLRAFAARAAHAGLDTAAYRRIEGSARKGEWLREWRRDIASVRRRIAERAPLLGAGRGAQAAALTLGVLYYSIKAAAYCASAAQQAPTPTGRDVRRTPAQG